VNHGHLSPGSLPLALNDEDVAIADQLVHHGITLDLERVQIFPGIGDIRGELDLLVRLVSQFDRLSGRNTAFDLDLESIRRSPNQA
jgi:hypothetical protein